MSEAMKESVGFYSAQDAFLINSILWGNKTNLDKAIESTHLNNTGMIREAMEQTPEVRFSWLSKEEAQRFLETYKRRTPDKITEAAKAEMIELAINDIQNICNAIKMHPADSDILLYRNIVAEDSAIKDIVTGKIVDFKGITSTSTTGQKISYGNKKFHETLHQYYIKVPAGMPVLVFGKGNDFRDDENEAILPPMQYKITDVRDGEECKIVELEPIKPLDVDLLIKEAKLKLEI